MKVRILSILVILCMAVCVSCSGDEPKTEKGKDTSSTEIGGGESPDDPNGNDSASDDDESSSNQDSESENEEPKISISDLTVKTFWTGYYYYERKIDSKPFEAISVRFNNGTGYSGTGEINVWGSPSKGGYYKLEFNIVGSKVIGTVNDKNGNPQDVIFKYKDGLLYVESDYFAPAILGCGNVIYSDSEGIFEDKSNMVYKVWLHENGMNILDLSDKNLPRIFQLISPRTKKFNYYDIPEKYTEGKTVYDFVVDTITICGRLNWYAWYVKEVTEDKMILQGFHDNFVDVYYAVTADVLPNVMIDRDSKTKEWGVGGIY